MARKIKRDKEIRKNYELHLAGRIWRVPEITLIKKGDHLMINQDEIEKWNRAAANVICSEFKPLTIHEYKFLADVAGQKQKDIAAAMDKSTSTISKWIDKGADLPFTDSIFLKLWFWKKLFEDKRPSSIGDELKVHAEYAIKKKLAAEIIAA